MEPRAQLDGQAGRRAVRLAHRCINAAIAIVLALLFALGAYALWDSHQVTIGASSTQWQPYKPSEENPVSFAQLQQINPDNIGWLSVYGTNIDYPLLYSRIADKYLTTNAKGEYSLTGALFLDARNSPQFTDFSTIVYGHHMEANAMFGQLTDFENRAFFDQHRYGNLYGAGRDWGLEFMWYLDADAYDTSVYRVDFPDEEARAGYLEHLSSMARNRRDVKVGPNDRIVLLSTCSTGATNGRSILVGKVCDKTFENTFLDWPNTGTGLDLTARFLGYPLYAWLLVLLLLVLLALMAMIRRQAEPEMFGPHRRLAAYGPPAEFSAERIELAARTGTPSIATDGGFEEAKEKARGADKASRD